MATGRDQRYPVFDVLRIVGALLVIVSHSFAVTGNAELTVLTLPAFPWTLGHLGVIVFFVTSGFLVTLSWERDPAAKGFLVRRVLRIWPALAVVVVGSALVLGPALTTLGARQYLGDAQTWGYVGHNLLLSPVTLPLPGVFTTNPLTAVNASIWTLPYEVLCYLGLVLAGVCRLLRPAVVGAALLGGLVLYRIGVSERVLDLTGSIDGVYGIFVVAFGVWFLAGMLLAHARALVVGRHAVAMGAAAALVGGRLLGEPTLVICGLSVAIVYVGTLPVPAAAVVRRAGDPSYGMYVWAFPIQQVLVWAGVHDPWAVVALAAPASIAAGYASWHLVERRAVRLAHRWTRRPEPTLDPRTDATTLAA